MVCKPEPSSRCPYHPLPRRKESRLSRNENGICLCSCRQFISISLYSGILQLDTFQDDYCTMCAIWLFPMSHIRTGMAHSWTPLHFHTSVTGSLSHYESCTNPGTAGWSRAKLRSFIDFLALHSLKSKQFESMTANMESKSNAVRRA